MDRTERFYKIDQMLQGGRCASFAALRETLDVSPATLKRDLAYLRDRLNAPIVWDAERRGYRFRTPQPGSPSYALPGLWFNPSEIHALLAMQQLLEGLQPGLLAPHVAPLQSRLNALLETAGYPAQEVGRRVRILRAGARRVEPACFQSVASALLQRRRLLVRHLHRLRNERVEREISPQRLVHYRSNWYLDSWCHLRNDIRSFGLDAIEHAEALQSAAREISDARLDAVLAAGYGIFGGERVKWARLRFAERAARWVGNERWHREQRVRLERDGSLVLEIPYSDDRELVMEVARHGPDVTVLGPAELRRRVAEYLAAALKAYPRPA